MTKQIRIIIATTLFFIAAIADVWGIITANETLQTVAKPMLLTLLALVYLVSAKKPIFWYVFGMFLCFVGDVLLMFDGPNFFMFGLSAFLLAHVVFIKVTSNFLQRDLTVKDDILCISICDFLRSFNVSNLPKFRGDVSSSCYIRNYNFYIWICNIVKL